MRIYVFSYFFFFSSRRRHTRLQGDWSSDVCSSDLVICEILNPDGTMARRADLEQFAQQHGLSFITVAELVAYRLAHERLRSEEHTSELQSPCNLVCRLLLEKKKKISAQMTHHNGLAEV